MFEVSMIVGAVIFTLLAVTVKMGVKTVPQGKVFIIERLGKFHSILNPGLNFIIPYIDSVAHELTTKDILLDIPRQEAITRDNAVILANALCFAKIADPAKAAYGVENYSLAVKSLTMTTLRSIIGEMSLDEALSSRDHIKAKLREAMSEQTLDWGLVIRSVEVQEIQPSESMQQAMEQQAAAERERKAAVTRAEGAKTAAILNAEGAKTAAILDAEARLEAAQRDAKAQVELASASAEAIRRVQEAAASSGSDPMLYLLGEKYIASMQNLASSTNAKMILLPTDLKDTINSMIGRKP